MIDVALKRLKMKIDRKEKKTEMNSTGKKFGGRNYEHKTNGYISQFQL